MTGLWQRMVLGTYLTIGKKPAQITSINLPENESVWHELSVDLCTDVTGYCFNKTFNHEEEKS